MTDAERTRERFEAIDARLKGMQEQLDLTSTLCNRMFDRYHELREELLRHTHGGGDSGD